MIVLAHHNTIHYSKFDIKFNHVRVHTMSYILMQKIIISNIAIYISTDCDLWEHAGYKSNVCNYSKQTFHNQ